MFYIRRLVNIHCLLAYSGDGIVLSVVGLKKPTGCEDHMSRVKDVGHVYSHMWVLSWRPSR